MGRLFNKCFSRKFFTLGATDEEVIHDDEFGDIEIRRVKGAFVRLKIQPNGKLIAQLPRFTSPNEVVKLLEASRDNLRQNLAKMPVKKTYTDGDRIGKSHHLKLRQGVRENVELKGLDIIVTLKDTTSRLARERLIKDGVQKALRQEAKSYLPRRLKYLSMQTGLSYDKVQFAHQRSRWGSNSRSRFHGRRNITISLNIMLMTLPNELIDYVLLHELNHTRHMDHSREFWADLEKICPHAKRRRAWLKQFSPYL